MRAALSDPSMWAEAMGIADAEIMDRVDPLDRRRDDARATCRDYDADDPPPGIWLGVSVEDQPRDDARRDDLAALAMRGWTTFVSYEPALGPVDWTPWGFLDWLISGGESGPRARPSHPDWHRAARDFCAARAIAYFFKRWGAWAPALEGRDLPYEEQLIALCRRGARDGWSWPDGVMSELLGKRAGRLLDGVEHNAFPASDR
jgi:protein gp37